MKTIRTFIPLAGLTVFLGCREISISPENYLGSDDALINITPSEGPVTPGTKSAEESTGVVIANLSPMEGSDGLVITEQVSDYKAFRPATKGIPVTTSNFADVFGDGFSAFAVFAGERDRSSDFASVFTRLDGTDIWSHYYKEGKWPEDNKLRYHFTAPSEMPSFIKIERASGAVESDPVVSFSIKGAYPGSADRQQDILFAGSDVTVIRGGTSENNPVTFKHVFTAVKFKQGNTDGKFNITGITLTNLPASGTCTVREAANAPSSESVVWSHPEGTVRHVDFSVNADGNNALFCIPKTFRDSDNSILRITYEDEAGIKKTIDMDFGKALHGKQWKAGQLYTYTLSVTDVGVKVTDTVEGNVKKDVVIMNTGNLCGYIRATMTAHWAKKTATDSETVLLSRCDLGNKGTFTGLAAKNWIKINDFYYYKYPVQGGKATAEPLFLSYTAGDPPFAGAFLKFVIMAQIVPFDNDKAAVTAAWGPDAASQLENK